MNKWISSNDKLYVIFLLLQDLRRLNLADNSIVELVPRVFYMLGKLKHLDLSGNPLIDLPPDVFKDILVKGIIFSLNFSIEINARQLYTSSSVCSV